MSKMIQKNEKDSMKIVKMTSLIGSVSFKVVDSKVSGKMYNSPYIMYPFAKKIVQMMNVVVINCFLKILLKPYCISGSIVITFCISYSVSGGSLLISKICL